MDYSNLRKLDLPAQEHILKVGFNGELRRFSFTGNSMKGLLDQIASILQVDVHQMNITYLDEENDWVTISTDPELQYALQLASNQKKPLRLNVSPKAEQHKPLLKLMPPSRPQEKTSVQTTELLPLLPPWKFRANLKDKKKEWNCKMIRFVKDVTIPDGTEVAPGAAFTKTWRIRNEGGSLIASVSPQLIFKKGDKMGAPNFISLQPLALNQEVDVSIPMVAPTEPGKYVGVWQICGPWGKRIGQNLKIKIRVLSSSSEEETPGESHQKWSEKLNHLETMGFVNKKRNIKLLVKYNGDVEMVIMHLLKKQVKHNKI